LNRFWNVGYEGLSSSYKGWPGQHLIGRLRYRCCTQAGRHPRGGWAHLLILIHSTQPATFKAELEPDVTMRNTLMKAYAVKGDGAACERVMRDMQELGLEPDVTTWKTVMNAYLQARSGSDVLRVFDEMRPRLATYDSFILSYLFNGLMFGLHGDLLAGARKVVELYPSLVTYLNLNHFVATPVLRALADVAPPAEVDWFWEFCRQHLESSSQGWPGQKNTEILSACCFRSCGRGSWGRVAALLSGAGAGDGDGSSGATNLITRGAAGGGDGGGGGGGGGGGRRGSDAGGGVGMKCEAVWSEDGKRRPHLCPSAFVLLVTRACRPALPR
jgi:pentatricopeptide repeat protein